MLCWSCNTNMATIYCPNNITQTSQCLKRFRIHHFISIIPVLNEQWCQRVDSVKHPNNHSVSQLWVTANLSDISRKLLSFAKHDKTINSWCSTDIRGLPHCVMSASLLLSCWIKNSRWSNCDQDKRMCRWNVLSSICSRSSYIRPVFRITLRVHCCCHRLNTVSKRLQNMYTQHQYMRHRYTFRQHKPFN